MSRLSKKLRAASEALQGAFLAFEVMLIMTILYWIIELGMLAIEGVK